MFQKFVTANRKVCSRIEPHLPQARTNIFELYKRLISHYMNSRTGQVVVDVGGGRSCPFANYRDPATKAKIIAIYVSEEELNTTPM